jgi:hypothetical protein
MKKRIMTSCLLWALVSCSNPVQPTSTAAQTSEGLASPSPTEALATLPWAYPTIEEAASPMTEPEEIREPQATPGQEWRGIPIMPAAIAGPESGNDNSYSFRTDASPTEIQDFYDATLAELGWTQPFDTPFDASGGRMTFRKEGMSLEIIVMSSEGSRMVLLLLTLA